MKQSFTKIYEKERELLRKANSVSAYEVYFHLKNDNSYFKKEFMDLRRCIADYLNIPERTVKDAIKRLISVGLIQTKKKGKVNYYILPYDSQNIDIITYNEEQNDRRRNDGIGKEDKTEYPETGRTEQFQDVHPLQEREQKQVGEITDTIPDKEKLTDENIFLLIQQGYEIDTIMKDWRNLIS